MFSSNIYSAEKQVVITVIEEWSKSLELLKELLSESYNEIGYKVVFRDLPAARGLNELEHGKVDGDIARTEAIKREYDVVLVRPPYFTLQSFVYYSKAQFPKPPTVNDIKIGNVAYMNGSFTVEKFLINAKYTIKAKDQTQLITLLKKKRVDYIIPTGSISTENSKLGKILLFEVSVYHVLSNKHKELAKKLGPVLRKNMAKKKYANLNERIKKLALEKSEHN